MFNEFNDWIINNYIVIYNIFNGLVIGLLVACIFYEFMIKNKNKK